jgi:hypothetical protein
MPGSGDKIDYSLRPAKQIERKMLCEAFRRLSVFQSVESYRYIGFGSFYFADFKLIHKSLGITDMVSFELESWKRKRFHFNNPFRCVKLAFGHSNTLLRDHWRNRRTILWLDYDDPLDMSCLRDVTFFCNCAPSGSVLLITVDAKTDEEAASLDEALLALNERVSEARVPRDVSAKHLVGWGTAKVSHRILKNEIEKVISGRNALLNEPEKLMFEQLFNFQYRDSARMLTVGGIIYSEKESEKFRACDFKSLKFVKSGVTPYRIELPRLTFREIRHLDSQLPNNLSQLKSKGIKVDDLRKYAKVYRWFPSFAEVEM